MKDYESIKAQQEREKARMCEEYCIHTHEPIPEGKDDTWLLEEDSPCNTCPINNL